ncbi:MAG TPA: hypothetical protein VNE39_09590 [Planctomycetota bacterium]|nr:hypothetical protein [Planctomycetota bacterium]
MTSRIPRLKDKPLERLIAKDGTCQPEILIFRDAETGAEIWSLTMEECKDLANIERRCPWNANGSVISLKGNRAFRSPDGKLVKQNWDGFSYLMHADGSGLCKFFATNPDGSRTDFTDKFNTWDRRDPACLYFTALKLGESFVGWRQDGPKDPAMYLIRVRVGPNLRENKPEPIYQFPNNRRKIIQNISDDNRLCIQDVNGKGMDDMPSCYIVDLNKKPGEPGFVRVHTLGYGGIQGVPGHDPNNEYRVHGITISRDGKTVKWGYGSMTEVGEYVSFSVPADNLDGPPAYRDSKNDPWGQYMSHPDHWTDGRAAYFAGPSDKLQAAAVKGGWGIWVRHRDKPPIFTGIPASGGHVTWCGGDPDWFFAHVSRPEKGWDSPIKGRIVTGKADGSVLKVLCNPHDRKRGGRAGYDGIPRPIQSPDATKCWFHSSMLMPSDAFTGSYIAVFRRPHPPVELKGEVVQDGLKLTWKPHPISREVKGYHVYVLHPDAGIGMDEATAEAVAGRETTLPVPKQPGGHLFAVTAEEFSGLESDTTSPMLCVTVGQDGKCAFGPSRKGTRGLDSRPPRKVVGFTATKDLSGGYLLKWTASPEKDLRYYNLYFSSSKSPEAVQARRIASPPRGTTEWLDWLAPREGRAFYALTAVDRHGNESEPAFAEPKE